jgi:hypothetical protein
MHGSGSVIFTYAQIASGKTFTLSGSEEEPGIIPRAMKDVFRFTKSEKQTGKEYSPDAVTWGFIAKLYSIPSFRLTLDEGIRSGFKESEQTISSSVRFVRRSLHP